MAVGETSSQMIDVEEQPDGSALIVESETEVGTGAGDFYDNLATTLPRSTLTRIAGDLIEAIEQDKEARCKRDKQYEEGLRRTGLGEDAPGGATFDGASRAVHPMLAEGCVEFSSRAIKELFPPSGPVKTKIVGYLQDAAAMDRAERKAQFLNWQLTEQMTEYKAELEQLLSQLPLGGSQFMKFWWDADAGRPMCEFVPIDNILIPFEASSFYTARRMTHMFPLDRLEFDKRMRSGLYIETELMASSIMPDETASQIANDKIEGKQDPGFNEDGTRQMYEVYVWLELKEDEDSVAAGATVPYIVTLDESSQEILGFYRNWSPNDPRMRKLDWFVKFPFIPWRGAYDIGLPHLIGGLSIAATGALRALLDSAHINNFPGGMKLKGGRASGQTVQVAPTELVEIEAPAGVDDIRKVVAPFPFPGPSSVLFQLLEWVTAAAKGVIMTSLEAAAQVGDRTPVGTTMALIEQSAITYSAIHSRLHESQKMCLKILQRIDRDFLDEQVEVEELGKLIIKREEFRISSDVIPVSDPAIFSEAQRYAQMQAVFQMAQDPTVPWNKMAIYKRALKQMKIDGAEEILPSPPKPVSADPITEIAAAMAGQPLAAQQPMPHMQHIQEELAFLLDPVFGAANPVIMNPGFMTIMNDIMQHLQMLFTQLKQQAQQQAQQMVMQQVAMSAQQSGVPPQMIPMMMQQQMQHPQLQQMVQQQAGQVWQQMQQGLQPMVQALQQADQLVKSKMPPPQDPALAAQMQIAQMQEQTKMQLGQMKNQLAQGKFEQDAAEAQMRIELEQFVRTQLEMQKAQMSSQTELAKNRDDNIQHLETELRKNRDDNETNLQMTQMREQAAAERAIVTKQMDIEAQARQAELNTDLAMQQGQANLTTQVVTETMRNALEREKMENTREIEEAKLKSNEKMATQAAKAAQNKPAPKKEQ